MPLTCGSQPATSRKRRRRSRLQCGVIRIRRRHSSSIKGWWSSHKADWRRRRRHSSRLRGLSLQDPLPRLLLVASYGATGDRPKAQEARA